MNKTVALLRIALIVALVLANLGTPVQAGPLMQADPPPPVANAGPPIVIAEAGQLVTLNGLGSSGLNITFLWEQIGGPSVTLTGATNPLATFIFPFVPGVLVPELLFRLTVTDSLGRSAIDTILVTEERPEIPPALRAVPVIEPPNLAQFVRNKEAAIQLGKALFWDMQVGSDGITACASCHYAAGTDNRVTNQVHPGPNGLFDVVGPNQTLLPEFFPFHLVDANLQVLRSYDDIVGTQGVISATFVGLLPGQAVDVGNPAADPVFHVDSENTRQVTSRNAASVINAVFNVRNFWDGRANFIFNGVSPFGNRDPDARIWVAQPDGSLAQQQILIQHASLASQAVTPANNSVEMAWRGRSFPLLGRKMLTLVPLFGQEISPTDSVLGPLVGAGGTALNVSYLDLIQAAFQPPYWDSDRVVVFDANGVPSVIPHPGRPLHDSEFSLVEMNFSLFFGLALQLYQATLISDQSRFDLYQMGQLTAMNAQELRGLHVFANVAVCTVCHIGAEFTSASVSAFFGIPVPGFPTEPPEPIERMGMANGQLSVYDLGFYNIGVRPTPEDLGQGGVDPFGNPLSFTRLLQNGTIIGPPLLNPPIVSPNEPSAVNGAFKTPGLRNLELTAPYMHTGSMSTIEQVIDFYARGADFAQENIADLAPAIVPLPLSEQDREDLAAFLRALTDERVRFQRAPFDHPQIHIPNGDELIEIAAAGAEGIYAVEPFVEINPDIVVTQVVAEPTIRAGSTTAITLTVTNPGDVILRNVVVASNVCTFGAPLEDIWTSGALDHGETWVLTCQATPAETVTSLVSVSARHKLNDVVSANSTQQIDVQTPSIALSIVPNSPTATAGSDITYTYFVTNTGNVPLTNVAVIDAGLGNVPLSATSLPLNGSASGTLVYAAQVADILTDVVSQATASGQPPIGGPVTAVAYATVDVTGAAVQLAMQPDRTSVNIGEALVYTYTVTNIGDVDLEELTVTDPRIGPITLGSSTLASTHSTFGTGSMLVVPSDAPGPLVTSAVVNGTAQGVDVSSSAWASVDIGGSASLTVTQTNPASAHVGALAPYSFLIANPGPVPIAGLSAHDSLLGPLTLATSTLDAGESTLVSVQLAVEESMLSGPLANTVTVTGTTAGGLTLTTQASGELALTSTPQLTIAQNIHAPEPSPGKSITYTFRVTNTGDITLRGLAVQSSRLGPIPLDVTQLPPNGVATGVGYYVIQEADLLAPFTNQSTATAAPRYGDGPELAAVDSDTLALVSHPALAVTMTPNPPVIGVGHPVSFLYQVTNIGDVSLSNIVLTDDRTGVVQLPVTALAPGASTSGSSTYVVHEGNLPGPLQNSAHVQGRSVLQEVATATNATEVTLTTGPALQVLATANPTPAGMEDTVEIAYLVKNVGNVSIDGIVLTDSHFGNVALPLTSLAPGHSTTATRTRTVTEADLPGPLVHDVQAHGTPLFGDLVQASHALNVPLSIQPLLQLTITPDGNSAPVGSTVNFTYTVVNQGDVTLSNVQVVDTRLGAIQLDNSHLLTGQTAVGSGTYLVAETDLDGPLVVQAQATANPPANLPSIARTATVHVALTTQPALNIQWTPSPLPAKVGELVTYNYTVTNVGNVSLENLKLTDSRLGPIVLDSTILPPTQSATGSASFAPGLGDLPGPAVTKATASGAPVYGSGKSISATLSTHLPLGVASALAGVMDAPGVGRVGETLQLTYRFTNTGDVILVNLAAADSVAGPVALATTVLQPGASTWGMAEFVVDEAYLPGPLANTLTITGTPPNGAVISSTTTSLVDLASQPGLRVTLVPDRASATIGQSVSFNVQVTNIGDVTLADLSLSSPQFGALALTRALFTPGETAVTTVTAPVLEADYASMTRSVTAVATTRYTNVPVIVSGDAAVAVMASPGLQIAIEAPDEVTVGSTVSVQYVLANRGNTTLTALKLTDARLGEIALPATELAPGAVMAAGKAVAIEETDLPGPIIFRASAQATTLQTQAVQAHDEVTSNVAGEGRLAISIIGSAASAMTNDMLNLTFEVENDGNLAIHALALVDDRFGAIALDKSTLLPGERARGALAHQITRDDLVGSFIHTARASGQDILGRQVVAEHSNTVALSGGTLLVVFDTGGDGQPIFDLQINGVTYKVTGAETHRLDALPTGRYEIDYQGPAAWKPLLAACDIDAWTTSSPTELSLNLKRGQTATCTFTVEFDESTLPTGSVLLHLPTIYR